MIPFAPWDEDPAKREKDAKYYIDMRKIGNTEDILLFFREKDGTESENGHILVLKMPKANIVKLSGLDPKFGIKLDENKSIFVRN